MEVDASARSEGRNVLLDEFSFFEQKSKEFTASPQSNED